MTSQSLLQSRKEWKALFAQGRKIASKAAKVASARPTAKTARDLLLDFDHADIALGLRVGQSRQLHRLPL